MLYFRTHLTEINDAGYQACLHAQGDRAVEQCMNAIENALNEQPNTLRHRIDHNSYFRPDMIARYSEIGIVPVIFGQFFTCSEQGIINYIGTDPLPWFENWHDLLAANPGLPIAWHSDTPFLEIDPFYNMYNYVTRKEIDEEGNICEPSPWNEAATITVEQTLPLLTTGPAYALFREDEVGSLKSGKLADIIIISANPLTVDPDSIVNIQVLMTMVNGIVEFCRPGNESLCPGSLGILTHDHSLVISISYPNPFSTSTTLEYELNHSESVTITFYNQFGKQVEVIEQSQPQGLNKLVWMPENLANGIYFFRLRAGEQMTSGKVILMK